MRNLTLILLFLITAASGSAAVGRVTDRIGLRDGLSNNFVTDIAQDGYGFIWIATDNGLNRFDGERFIVFSEKDRSLKGNSVNSLYYDDVTDRLWVGSKKGVDIIDCATLESAGPPLPDEIGSLSVVDFAPAGKEGIYILGNYGFIGFYDRSADSCRVYRESDFDGLIMSMHAAGCNSDNRLVAGQENYGLSIIDLRSRTLENFMHDPGRDGSLPGNNVSAVLVSRDGDIFAGTDHGVCRFDRENGLFLPVDVNTPRGESIGNGSVKSLIELSDGTLLASGSEVLFQDTYGNIWIGTAGNGIEFIPSRPSPFEKIVTGRRPAGALLSEGTRLLAGVMDEIVLATDGSLTEQCDLSPLTGTANAGITAMARVAGGLLVSVAGDGLFLVDGVTGEMKRIATPYEKDYASTIFPVHDGGALLGTQHGLYEYRDGCISRNEKISSATGYLVPNGIVTDRRGRLWIGTYGNGIFIFDKEGNAVAHLTDGDGLASNAVKQLFADSRQWIWLAGQDGVSVIRDINCPGLIRSFSYDSGLTDISIRSIAEDLEGNIWLASNNVLSRYNVAADSIETFGNRLKMTESSFIDRAVTQGPDGRLYFGALDGIYSFSPSMFDRLLTHGGVPPVRITGYSTADGQLHYSPAESIELPRGCTSVKIMFAIPDFSLRGKVSCSYMVEGLSDEWMPAPDSHEMTLEGLHPGTYYLRVRPDGLYGGNAGSADVRIRIDVRPPLWLTGQAIALYVVLACMLICVAVRFGRRRRAAAEPPAVASAAVETPRPEGGMSRVDREFLERFTSLVEQNIGRPDLDMEFLRAGLNMSHSTLYRRLKNLTGMSGSELIKKQRLRKGCEMLRQGFSVSETAYACGFSDPGYFRTCFKNEYGKSPSELKNSVGQTPD